MILLFAWSGRHASSPTVSCCCKNRLSQHPAAFSYTSILFSSVHFYYFIHITHSPFHLMFEFFPLSLCSPLPLFSLPLVSLSFPQPSHSSLNIPQNLPLPSLSLCARIEVGARALFEVRGLYEWPCERVRGARTRRGVAKERVRRRGGGLDMAMWMMFWCWLCSWPPGSACVTGSVCVRWVPLWAEDKQLRKRREKLKKPRPNSIVRYLICSFLFRFILTLSVV